MAVMSGEDGDAIKLVSEWLGLFKGATAKMSATKKPMLFQTHTQLTPSFAPFNRLSSQFLTPAFSYEGLKQDYESDWTLFQSLEDAKDELYTDYTTHYAKSPSLISPGDTAASTTTTPTSPSKFDFLGRYKRRRFSDITAQTRAR
ncbi:hypothetical protein DFH08DRAFT_802191 [Mycena albidolilacea]|uniref:Uncharacterized protein n=1 Tax=Mycena albidolilacea TaxID=1033008 RepID=A0AAD7AGX7_9AGAR|nr:hypothetical protein DFH08DRAFT_802191 [Mycena albidolilacea]